MKKNGSPLPSVIGCLVAQFCVGILYVWSVLKSSAMGFYGWEEGAVNLVASFMLFAFCLGNFIGGVINDRIGPQKVCMAGILLFGGGLFLASLLPAESGIVWFYLCYCLIGGLGCGFTYGAVISCMQKWFPHRRGFASGIGTAAFGLATVVFSPVIGAMLTAFTIRETLRILSLVFLFIGVCACLFIRLPSAEYLSTLPRSAAKGPAGKAEDVPFSRAVRTLPFWCLTLGIFFYNGTWSMLTPLIKGLGMSRGLSETAAIMAVSFTGFTNAAGRLLMAMLSDKLGRINTMYLLSALTALCALLLLFVGGWAYFVIVLVTAFAYGGPSAINPATSTDFFGSKYSGTNYGVIMLALGVSSIFFNAISNAMYSLTGGYTLTFLTGAVSAVITGVLMALIQKREKGLRT